MRFASWGFVAACGFLLAGPAAKAAEIRIPDLPSPQYDWTGFYAGVYGGGAFAAWAADYCRNGACRHADGQASGFAVGVYGGYQHPFFNPLFVGGGNPLGENPPSPGGIVFFGNPVVLRVRPLWPA